MMFKAALMATMLTSQAASPAPPPAAANCITREQAGSMGVVGAALFVNIARNACRPHLRPSAFLQSAAGRAYVANIVADGRRRLPAMLTGVSTMARGGQDRFMSGFLRGFVTGMLQDDGGVDWAEYADPLICGDADEMIAVMATLSPDQVGRFTGAFMSLSDRMSRTMMRAFANRRIAPVRPAPPPPPAALPGSKAMAVWGSSPSRPNSRAGEEPMPVLVAPPPPPGPPPPPPPPLMCPEPQ
jgi:hypothetical protein